MYDSPYATPRRLSRPVRAWTLSGALLLAAALQFTGLVAPLDHWLYDLYITSNTRTPPDDILVVAIDEPSLAALGRWPWPRQTHARLLERLDHGRARRVILDILFSEPDLHRPEQDAVLARALGRADNRVLAVGVGGGTDPGLALFPAGPFRAQAALGHSGLWPDSDGVLRRVRMGISSEEVVWPALSLAATRRISGPHAASAPSESPPQRDLLLPFGGPGPYFTQVSYVDLLEGRADPAIASGRFVLIGATAAGLGTAFTTPWSTGAGPIPGVVLQAHALDALLHDLGSFPANREYAFLWTLSLTLAIALLTLSFREHRVLRATPLSWLLVLAVGWLAIDAFGWALPLAPALVAISIPGLIVLLGRNRRLWRHAYVDSVTGLPNRRAFELKCGRVWEQCQRSHCQMSILMLDIDAFKAYNDLHGHLQGDRILRRVGEVIGGGLRQGDFAARFGGEEFVVLVAAGDGRQAAFDLAEHLRIRLLESRIPHPASTHQQVLTLSVGGACCFPGGSESPNALIKRADQALYEAKHRGRNCAVWSQSPDPATGIEGVPDQAPVN